MIQVSPVVLHYFLKANFSASCVLFPLVSVPIYKLIPRCDYMNRPNSTELQHHNGKESYKTVAVGLSRMISPIVL